MPCSTVGRRNEGGREKPGMPYLIQRGDGRGQGHHPRSYPPNRKAPPKPHHYQGLGFLRHSSLLFSVALHSLRSLAAMAAVSMTMAVASTRFVAVAARADPNLSRNAAALSMAAPITASAPSMLGVFLEFAKPGRSGMNAAIVARASDLEQGAFGEVVTDEAEAEAEAAPAPVQQGSKLYVGNLPWTCDSAQLAEICQDIGTVEAVEVIYDQESGRSRGFAFVTMASNDDAQAVINSLDGTDLGGRTLRVNYPQPKGERPRFERGERPERSERRPFGGGERRRDDNPNKLFVGNLSWGCDDGALYELFKEYGTVVDAKVVQDRETGRSRGFGFVTLQNASEVNDALGLDGTDFDGRQLRVNLAGDKPPPRF